MAGHLFDASVQTANIWLRDLDDRLGSGSRQIAYDALRAVLHVLRDRLPLETVLGLSAQSPLLIRGVMLEGWRPQDGPSDLHDAADLEAAIRARLPRPFPIPPLDAARGVFALLSEKLDPGETRKIAACLPQPIRALWPSPWPEANSPRRARKRGPERPGLTLLQWGLMVTAAAVLGTGFLAWSTSAGSMASSVVLAVQTPIEPGSGIQRIMLALLVLGAVALGVAASIGLILRRDRHRRRF